MDATVALCLNSFLKELHFVINYRESFVRCAVTLISIGGFFC